MKRDIVVVHGALGSALQMQTVAEALSDLGEVRVVELPGHGSTELGEFHQFNFDSFIAAIFEHIARPKFERSDRGLAPLPPPIVFGYSMGGYAALEIAMGLTDCPVGGVVTLGTKFHWTPEIAERENARLNAEVIREKLPKFAAVLSERHSVQGGWTCVLENTRNLLTSLGAHDQHLRERYADINCPAVLAVGERDDTVSADETREVAGWIRNGTPVVLPGVPHPIEKVLVTEIVALVRDCMARADGHSARV